jgi:hypothetical protein
MYLKKQEELICGPETRRFKTRDLYRELPDDPRFSGNLRGWRKLTTLQKFNQYDYPRDADK